MSTRAGIGRVNDRGGIDLIYSHYDGYPSHVGKILKEYHNSLEACCSLLGGAHIRNFDSDGTVCRFGEGDGAYETYGNVEEALSSGFDYVYLYGDEGWKCYGNARRPMYGIDEIAIP